MPSLANLSMRGVGIVPPYTPKFPQPTLSTRMKTMLGFLCGTDWASASFADVTSPIANTALTRAKFPTRRRAANESTMSILLEYFALPSVSDPQTDVSVITRCRETVAITLHLLLYLGFRFLNRAAAHLLDHVATHLVPHSLEFLLLGWIEDRHDFGVDGGADLLQLLDLLQRLERRVLLQRADLL